MKNRYDDILRINNDAIISLSPANHILRLITALEFKKYYKDGMRTLEIGCGEGHSALEILKQTNALMDLLDLSPEMIEESKKNLSLYIKNLTFIQEDALSYLEQCASYDIITSSWTLHNLEWAIKEKVFKKMYDKLLPNGVLILMDKIYPLKNGEELFAHQIKRYRYLANEVAEEIKKHEIQDKSDIYRIDEQSFVEFLTTIGFKNIEIADRVERDIVLIAHK